MLFQPDLMKYFADLFPLLGLRHFAQLQGQREVHRYTHAWPQHVYLKDYTQVAFLRRQEQMLGTLPLICAQRL
jgi:hypothetical protein